MDPRAQTRATTTKGSHQDECAVHPGNDILSASRAHPNQIKNRPPACPLAGDRSSGHHTAPITFKRSYTKMPPKVRLVPNLWGRPSSECRCTRCQPIPKKGQNPTTWKKSCQSPFFSKFSKKGHISDKVDLKIRFPFANNLRTHSSLKFNSLAIAINVMLFS